MFREYLQEKITTDEGLGIWVAPRLPAVRLGKILMSETRISQPGDVVVLHLSEGLFNRVHILITVRDCFYEGGSFPLAEVRSALPEGSRVKVTVNQLGSFYEVSMKTGSEAAAKVIARALDGARDWLNEQEKAEAPQPAYENFEGKELDWLRLRDEVMKTIDQLYEKFNEGKLSLLEYEEKKQELLARL